jgi:hypothetical protein
MPEIRPVPPPVPLCTVEDLGDSLKITIPNRRKRFLGIFSVAVAIFWLAFGAFLVYATILMRRPLAGGYILSIPKMFYILPVEWLVGSIVMGGAFLWVHTFRQVIEVSSQSIIVHYRTSLFNRSRNYLSQHIGNLRAASTSMFFGHSAVIFDYGAKTFSFGRIDEAEAKQIVKRIWQKFPQYAGESPADLQ